MKVTLKEPMKTNQPIDIEIEVLKAKIENLEHQVKFLNSNWVEWTKSTKDLGQKIIIGLEQLLK